MRRSIFAVAAFAVSLTALGASDEDVIKTAQAMVASKLKDPESARFSDSFIYRRSDPYIQYTTLCGKVNSKNSFGGYTGAMRYSATLTFSESGDVEVLSTNFEEGDNLMNMEDGLTIFEKLQWRGICAPGETPYEVGQKFLKQLKDGQPRG